MTLFVLLQYPGGRILAHVSRDKKVRWWNLKNGQPIGSPFEYANELTCVLFSTDGKLLARRDNSAYS